MEGVKEGGQQPQQSVEDIVATEVAGNDRIRERILYFAIYQDNGKKILRKAIGSLRLVQKSWLKSITVLFKKNRDPLYKFILSENISLNETTLGTQNGRILHQFVHSVTSPNSFTPDIIPTFSLDIRPTFFRLENYRILYKCMRLCGDAMVDIKMTIPINGGSMPGMFHGYLSLPSLNTFTVHFLGTELPNMKNGECVIVHDFNATYFLQSFLLGAAASLTEFVSVGNKTLTKVPSGFQYLAFPPTLTKLHITNTMDAVQMELLAECELPHLVNLQFCCAPDVPYENDVFSRIFNNFRLSLQTLTIVGVPNNTNLETSFSYQFPLMEKLETFETFCSNCELSSNQSLALDTCLPNLHKVTLHHQIHPNFQNWTKNYKFLSVKLLRVLLTSGIVSYGHRDRYICNLDKPLMQQIHKAFPNLTYLEMTTSSTNFPTTGFKYLFTEMRQLVYLVVYVEGSSPEGDSNAFWDALLTGLPEKLAAALRESPEVWDNLELKCERLPSIVGLKELKGLSLLDKRVIPAYPDITSRRLISDVAFHYGFLRMENLEKICFQGGFMASDVMTEEWTKKRGKTLKYST